MHHCEGQKDASTCCLAAQGFDKDAVGIVIVYDEDIIVARAGGNDEFAVLVGMNSPCGGFKQSGKTLMRVEVIDVAKRERGGGFSRWDEVVACRQRGRGRSRSDLGGPMIFPGLVQVSFDCSNRLWWMFPLQFGYKV